MKIYHIRNIFSERKKPDWSVVSSGMRPVLPADQNFSPFFAFLAKTCPKPPFGIPRAFQPPKNNIIIFLDILFHVDSHSVS
jgi:hypothetical protein